MSKYLSLGNSENVFVEEGYQPSKVRLSDEEYPRSVARFAYHCCDVVPWMRNGMTGLVNLCLAKRCIDPAREEWWVYGGSMNPGERMTETAIRHFEDDTGLSIEPIRLVRLFGDAQQYLWANGVVGYSMHVFADTFAFEITQEEFAFARNHLRASEYYPNCGIRLFDLSDLQKINAHPGIIRIYKAI